jgi:hypothetical protein
MTRHERELRGLKRAYAACKWSLKATKHRGRDVKRQEKHLRKKQFLLELAARECEKLPKPWKEYQAHGKHRDLYSRPEVANIHSRLRDVSNAKEFLQECITKYKNRLMDRKEAKRLLFEIPINIETLEKLITQEQKKSKPKKEKDWKAQWLEVFPDSDKVINVKTLNRYLKTFKNAIWPGDVRTIVGVNTVTVYPTENKNIYLRLPIVSWDHARYMNA